MARELKRQEHQDQNASHKGDVDQITLLPHGGLVYTIAAWALMRRPIRNHTRRGELVYDPFLASGTTLAAAEGRERACCGLELDAQYDDVVVQRWQQLSGQPAKLEDDGRTFESISRERKQK